MLAACFLECLARCGLTHTLTLLAAFVGFAVATSQGLATAISSSSANCAQLRTSFGLAGSFAADVGLVVGSTHFACLAGSTVEGLAAAVGNRTTILALVLAGLGLAHTTIRLRSGATSIALLARTAVQRVATAIADLTTLGSILLACGWGASSLATRTLELLPVQVDAMA